jgi:hypothetical protein
MSVDAWHRQPDIEWSLGDVRIDGWIWLIMENGSELALRGPGRQIGDQTL